MAALTVAAVVGAIAAVAGTYNSFQQGKEAEAAAKQQAEAQKAADLEARRIASSKEENTQTATLKTGKKDRDIGDTGAGQLAIKKDVSIGTGSAGLSPSGLGFSV